MNTCYSVNSASSQTSQIMSAKKIGFESGFTIRLFFANDTNIKYVIGDSQVQPIYSEVLRLLSTGLMTNLVVTKSNEAKKPEPYNNCVPDLSSIDSYDSVMYKKTFKKGFKYRQINCFDICTAEYIAEKCNCSELLGCSLLGEPS